MRPRFCRYHWTVKQGAAAPGSMWLPPLSESPLFSIIVPSYNQGAFIARTLDSIFSQSYRPLEVIVIDGGSGDETVDVLTEYAARHNELRWMSEPDRGVADAVNKGLRMAHGELVGIQSSDDLYYAEALSETVSTIQQNPGCGMVYGDADNIDINDRLVSHYRVPDYSWPSLFGISLCLPQSSIFFRMDLARAVGGWNEEYFSCDLDYWLRLLLRAPAVHIPRSLSAWRTYPEQRTQPRNFSQIVDGYRRMIMDSVELAQASPRLRRLARASVHSMAVRFRSNDDRWALRRNALCALLLYPGAWRYWHGVPLRPLVPGVGRMHNAWSRSCDSSRTVKLIDGAWRRAHPPRVWATGPQVVPGGPNPVSPW